MSKNPFIAKVDTIVARAPLNMSWTTLDEAKGYVAAIRQLKAEIGFVKKEVTTAKQQIHANSVNQRAHVGKGFGAGAATGLFGANAVGRANSARKNDMRNHELNALKPYQEAETYIAQVILGLDKLKLQLDTWIAAQKR